jgi:hypothetical protein
MSDVKGVSLKAKATFVASCLFSAGMIYFVHVNQKEERQVRLFSSLSLSR